MKQREKNGTEKRFDSTGGSDSSQVDPAELNTRKLRERRRMMMFHCRPLRGYYTQNRDKYNTRRMSL